MKCSCLLHRLGIRTRASLVSCFLRKKRWDVKPWSGFQNPKTGKRISSMKSGMLAKLILVLAFLPVSYLQAEPATAKQGILDLRSADPDEIHFLDGDWAFYWNRFVNPLSLRSPESAEGAVSAPLAEKPDLFAEVPDDWNSLEVAGARSGSRV